jgi:hypothetical protein
MKPRADSRVPTIALVIALTASVAACPEPASRGGADIAPDCEEPGVREVVERLGERMAQVSLQGPDSQVVHEVREAYAGIASEGLLASWTTAPRSAPGRLVSSPWPDRIEIDSVSRSDAGSCRVEGDIVLVSSADAARTGEATRQPVTVWVTHQGAWLITRFERERSP